MKATVWLWPVITTLLCVSQFVCTAQREFQEFPDSSLMQDDYLLEKRTKPSLSIVNPLDVLRQRLLLEIARRQMRENTKQVEINRAILKNVGKRANHRDLLQLLRQDNDDKKDFNNDDDDFQIRYLYSLHKNRYTRK